ncbi:prepilin peptidase [Fusobacterium sp.]|uniref:prepilin peptidase n=1 Tax=Fusobacterium sp. TaxID=68766 RepID=UPI00261D6A5C|nr:prepilin peptidase [Fusobacterium sp.]
MGRSIIDILFGIILLIILIIDFKKKIIPDALTITIIILGIIKIIFFNENLENKLIGMGTYSILFNLLYGYGEKIFKKEVVGFGDIKLLSSIGFYLGYFGLIYLLIYYNIIFLISPIYGIIYKKLYEEEEIPFAPVIILSTFIFIIIKGRII